MAKKAMLHVLAAVIGSGVHLWHTYTEYDDADRSAASTTPLPVTTERKFILSSTLEPLRNLDFPFSTAREQDNGVMLIADTRMKWR